MQGLYFHIPFCKQACSYCDFHFSTNLRGLNEVSEMIMQELDLRYNYLAEKNIDSVYFGGGTPSLLPDDVLERLMDRVSRHFLLNPGAEVTLEANPDDITAGRLRNWKRIGINRLSIGLQSFNDEELKWMNRVHNASQSESCIKLAQDNGFSNITIDLIYGSRFQTDKSWEQTLKRAVELGTQHISAYNLTVEQKTALGVQVRKKLEPVVDEELSGRQFLRMISVLEGSGFIQYEISNFGKKGFFAVHNTNYWLQQPYLGLGPSAHSFNGTSRQWNLSNNNLYIKALRNNSRFYETEELSNTDLYNEYVMTRLRTIWGCDLEEMEKRFGKELRAYFLTGVERQQKYFNNKKSVVTLNRDGKLLADRLAASLFA